MPCLWSLTLVRARSLLPLQTWGFSSSLVLSENLLGFRGLPHGRGLLRVTELCCGAHAGSPPGWLPLGASPPGAGHGCRVCSSPASGEPSTLLPTELLALCVCVMFWSFSQIPDSFVMFIFARRSVIGVTSLVTQVMLAFFNILLYLSSIHKHIVCHWFQRERSGVPRAYKAASAPSVTRPPRPPRYRPPHLPPATPFISHD